MASVLEKDLMVERVRSYALAHYDEDGWDFIVECYTDEDILDVIHATGARTATQAVQAVLGVVRLLAEQRWEVMRA